MDTKNIPPGAFDVAKQLSEASETMNKAVDAVIGAMDIVGQFQKSIENLVGPIDDFFEKIGRAKTREYLYQNGWIYSPSLKEIKGASILLTDQVLNLSNKQLNTLYFEIFWKDDFAVFESMIDEWVKIGDFKKREALLRNCHYLLKEYRATPFKNSNKLNPANLVIPVLIAQIDGVMLDLLLFLGVEFDGTKVYMPNGKPHSKTGVLWELPYDANNPGKFIAMLEDVLFGRAFSRGQKNPAKAKEKPKQVRPFTHMNRNKIMHGEALKYGQFDNVIRLLLLLDCLAFNYQSMLERSISK